MSDRPAGEGIAPGHFPPPAVGRGHHAPAPRRIRGRVGDTWVFDSVAAHYVWEHAFYPQYAVPLADVAPGVLVDDGVGRDDPLGRVARHSLVVGDDVRRGVAAVRTAADAPELLDTVSFKWAGIDHWFEEDEEIFVHPRSPYVRVDAVRSSRRVRVELDGHVLAESSRPVAVFETGLPVRWYVDAVDVDFSRLEPSDTVTSCPYKGTTGRYWSYRHGDAHVADVAWCYDFPTWQVQPIAGLLSFYDDRTRVVVD